ncbi:MAG TPA: hypothetical protein PK322_08935 [Opitutaceae bacterium]|nr:hypothetical protein [Opitutaceae bacterium]
MAIIFILILLFVAIQAALFLGTAYETARRYAKIARDARAMGRLDVVFDAKREIDTGSLMSKAVLYYMEKRLGRDWAADPKAEPKTSGLDP